MWLRTESDSTQWCYYIYIYIVTGVFFFSAIDEKPTEHQVPAEASIQLGLAPERLQKTWCCARSQQHLDCIQVNTSSDQRHFSWDHSNVGSVFVRGLRGGRMSWVGGDRVGWWCGGGRGGGVWCVASSCYSDTCERSACVSGVFSFFFFNREESALVDIFTLEILITFLESLALAHGDDPALGTLLEQSRLNSKLNSQRIKLSNLHAQCIDASYTPTLNITKQWAISYICRLQHLSVRLRRYLSSPQAPKTSASRLFRTWPRSSRKKQTC